MWCLNVLVFALWFWQLDVGARRFATPGLRRRDFLFHNRRRRGAARGWQPRSRLPLPVVHERDRVQSDGYAAAQPLGEGADDG